MRCQLDVLAMELGVGRAVLLTGSPELSGPQQGEVLVGRYLARTWYGAGSVLPLPGQKTPYSVRISSQRQEGNLVAAQHV